ncbi:FkbM family methyltransferase [Synechococcales cyanobacterium C]|uniref:FkbM family methyltransferase n=1 Tax=Petrachloros mirabilis ULC683 TaxID=2781853 RepID=A0A8K2AGZ6_9CYAN|nr:FkbM family methyltransferase [Petrachloros mirabilis]NCJ05729.1 FkbM family methyltransferase [Petrachloros mirabilis ULC683]
MEPDVSYLDAYFQHIKESGCELSRLSLLKVKQQLLDTQWQTPQTAVDFNNVGVVALIEAQRSSDEFSRKLFFEMAVEALDQGAKMGHPLCQAHLALSYSLIGELDEAIKLAFTSFIQYLQATFDSHYTIPAGLIFLPTKVETEPGQPTDLQELLLESDGYTQALKLSAWALCFAQFVFYNASGLRLLQLAVQQLPDSIVLNLQAGISHLVAQRQEGLYFLQRARGLAPDSSPAMQALAIAYRDQGNIALAQTWLDRGKGMQSHQSREWRWAELAVDSSFTYLTFEPDLLLAVEPSFRSIVTSVLLAQGDWFEKEMEFWRHWLKPGMTVIDVGANAGVYTFSAARQVGSTGKVLAVEPFSGCVRLLKETCRVNSLGWVKVCAGAASDRNGISKLAVQSASELNQLMEGEVEGAFEEIECFTLDSLCEREGLSQVDFLKIDAEGHEVPVLQGSQNLLEQSRPVILYENISGSQGSNLAVSEFLVAKGYRLHYYQPFLKELVEISSSQDIQGKLNIIALPEK